MVDLLQPGRYGFMTLVCLKHGRKNDARIE
jgi:hypothetical protein